MNVSSENRSTIRLFDFSYVNESLIDFVNRITPTVPVNTAHTRIIVTPNPEMVVNACQDLLLKEAIQQADYILPDGVGIILAARLLGKPVKQRMAGSDLVQKLLSSGQFRIYLFGGKPGVAESAALKMKNDYPNQTIVGHQHGYFQNSEEAVIIQTINSARPDILLVGLGSPKQELWVHRNRDKLKVPLIICVGGVLDILSGNLRRAPRWVISMGMEWFYRLTQEPRRIKRLRWIIPYIIMIMREKKSKGQNRTRFITKE